MSSAKYDPARPLALMHVPKSLGTSLTDGLARAIQPARAATGFDRALFGAFDRFETFDPITQAAIFHTPNALPDADFVAGHISFATLRARYPAAQMVTVLREPVSRLLSHWLFWRGHSDAQLAGWGAWGNLVKVSRQPLATFLGDARLACQNDNQVVRMLLWPHPLIPASRFIDPAHDTTLLAEARGRLLDFDFVDVAEGGGFAKRLRDWLGRPFALERRNETAPIPAHLRSPLEGELTQAALGLLTGCSRLDHQLWLDAARQNLPDGAAVTLAESARLASVNRFAGLMTRPTTQ